MPRLLLLIGLVLALITAPATADPTPVSPDQKAIRNYDPCISCSTHFVKLTVHRG